MKKKTAIYKLISNVNGFEVFIVYQFNELTGQITFHNDHTLP